MGASLHYLPMHAQCLENMKAIVEAAGGSMANIVKVGTHDCTTPE